MKKSKYVIGLMIGLLYICTACQEARKLCIPDELWGLKNMGQTVNGRKGQAGIDINVEAAWEITKGKQDIIIGILDSGVDISVIQSLYINEQEIYNDGIDNDKNGYVDDKNGWDFYNGDGSVYDGYAADFHGTYIASLIGLAHDTQNNVWGVAPETTILPLKFMSGTNGDIKDVIQAVEYGCTNGVKVMNCSWNTTENCIV